MKTWVLAVISFSLFIISCKKKSDDGCTYTESTVVATAGEIAWLDSALTADGISAIQHPSGAFYTIDSVGTGVLPNLCSNMQLTYTGNVYGNPVNFDSYTDSLGITLQLGSLVVGWQKVLQLVQGGSKLRLFIPPTLGYGGQIRRNGDGDILIPAYSYLVFNINLLRVF